MNGRYWCWVGCVLAQICGAQTFVCQDGRGTVYSTEKLNDKCVLSRSTSSEPAAASSVAVKSVPDLIDEQIKQIWTEAELSGADTIILPPVVAPAVGNAGVAVKPSVRVPKIRQAAPVVAVAPVKPPQLTRRQILQRELNREKTALSRAQASLKVAQSKNDLAAVQRFNAQVKDRRLNIESLEQEIRK